MSLITSKCFTTPPDAIRPLRGFRLPSSNDVIFNKSQASRKYGAIQSGFLCDTLRGIKKEADEMPF